MLGMNGHLPCSNLRSFLGSSPPSSVGRSPSSSSKVWMMRGLRFPKELIFDVFNLKDPSKLVDKELANAMCCGECGVVVLKVV